MIWIPILEILGESLLEFSGAQVLATHGLYFLDHIANAADPGAAVGVMN
jgi:ATPase subunit of ABC transporter with duplicated ATPase domains